MGLFEYLGVLISVVIGLGMAHLLTGVASLIHERDSVRVDAVHLAWTLGVTTYLPA